MIRSLAALFTLALLGSCARGADWPQWMGKNRDAVWSETGILSKFPASGPKVLWRVPVGGGYSGPAVEDGKVYVTDRQLAKGVHNPEDPFVRHQIAGVERVLCFDA